MLFFRKKKRESEDSKWNLNVDWHCHILPGVDDGVKTMEDALAILQELEKRGVKEIWLTPHVMEDIPNATDDLRERFEQLKSEYAKLSQPKEGDHNEKISLHLASENMLDELFSERLEKDDLLPFDNQLLLVETSFFAPPHNFYELLERVMKKGYFPVLAHPERYEYMDDKDYKKLKDMGVKFQLNLMSLVGHYGPVAQKKAKKMKDSGFYEFTGTDLHRKAHLNVLDHVNCN